MTPHTRHSAREPLHILMVAPQLPPAVGGVETHIEQLSGELARLGHRVTLVGTAPQAGARRSEHPSGGLVDTILVRRPLAGTLLVPPPQLFRTVRRLADRTVDIVHLHAYHQPHAAISNLALPSTMPRVFSSYYHGVGHTSAARLAHPLYRTLLGRNLIQTQDQILCLSEAEQALLLKRFPTAATTVIPAGVTRPAAVEPFPHADNTRVALSVGRLETYKQFDRLIAATPEQVTLYIVGDGPERARLEQLARRANGGPVRLLGRADDVVLAALWARAEVYLAASRHESYGLTVGTAIAAGIPTVASDIAAHREIAGGMPGVHLVDCDAGRDSWAAAITRAFAGPRPTTAIPTPGETAQLTAEAYHAVLLRRRLLGR